MQPSLEKLSKALLRVPSDLKGLQNKGLKPGHGPKTNFSKQGLWPKTDFLGEGPAKR